MVGFGEGADEFVVLGGCLLDLSLEVYHGAWRLGWGTEGGNKGKSWVGVEEVEGSRAKLIWRSERMRVLDLIDERGKHDVQGDKMA